MITFTSSPDQTFSATIDGELYTFQAVYNGNYDFWSLYISQNDDVLAAGIKMVTKSPLTEQYPNIPFDLQSDYSEDANGDNIEEFMLEVTSKNA